MIIDFFNLIERNMTLSKQDLKQLASRGISEKQVEKQLKQIAEGFPFLRLEAAASVGNGIVAPSNEERDAFIQQWKQYKERPHKIVKFVPASGAASRMFKNMFAFLSAPYEVPTTDFEKTFFAEIEHFAFKDVLNEACKANQGKDIVDLIAEGRYKDIVANLLQPAGLNYGSLPKGLLLFHNYEDGPRTPMEEHLVEAALYANCNGEANVHFTVSHDHLALFKAKVKEKADHLAKKFGVSYNISFSEQKPSTDTIAANTDNTPFRNADQSMLFRPGGHGALIENLNEINADIVFIKNIDNVVPDRLKPSTVTYKQLLAGILVDIQQKIFNYLALLDTGKYSHEELEEIKRFVQNDLCCRKTGIDKQTDTELAKYLRTKLNRPIRVCGVVKNVGEPGGGPFLTYNQDGTVSLQILESSQIDTANEEYMKMFRNGTHFNPVDLVCAIKDYQGHAFHLPDYIDHSTGFISNKSKDGRELKALELPGLWNGAMSDWNTIFVEVPLETFNPVKTVNDLLREQHQ
jgi:conserved hypothetical protein